LQEFSGGELALARKLGVSDDEIAWLCHTDLEVLGKGQLSPDEIRDATGNASRNLGPEGAKKSLTTTLPVALGKLQVAGQIRRVPSNGRLDQQRYRYALWKPNPLDEFKLTAEEVFYRAGPPILSLDRPGIAHRVSVVFKTWRQSSESGDRAARARSGRAWKQPPYVP